MGSGIFLKCAYSSGIVEVREIEFRQSPGLTGASKR
jgi:hypothetical protein